MKFSTLNLDEIINIDKNLKDEYDKYLAYFMTNRIYKSIVANNYGEPIELIEELIYEAEVDYKSNYIAPNNILVYYPNVKYKKYNKYHECNISGELIIPNEYYYLYKPFIENLTKNIALFSKHTYKIKEGYDNFIPKTLNEFESFLLGINYEIDESYNNISIDEISKRFHEGIDFISKSRVRKKRD